MIRFLTDENFNGHVIGAFRSAYPQNALLTALEAGLESWDDPRLLEWAAQERRVILSHDERTMIGFAHERMAAGLSMAGLVKVPQYLRLKDVIYDLGIIDQCSSLDEWEGRVFHLPI